MMFSEPTSYDQEIRTDEAVTSDICTLVGDRGRAEMDTKEEKGELKLLYCFVTKKVIGVKYVLIIRHKMIFFFLSHI